MNHKLTDCTEKLTDLNRTDSLKILFEQVKTGHINFSQFASLVQMIPENSNTVKLQPGMQVKIVDNILDFPTDANTVKTITKELPPYGPQRAFALDGDEGIWLIDDFQFCVEHPDKVMV